MPLLYIHFKYIRHKEKALKTDEFKKVILKWVMKVKIMKGHRPQATISTYGMQ